MKKCSVYSTLYSTKALSALIFLIFSVLFLIYFASNQAPHNDIVSINLAVGKDGYISLKIPKKYIGPSKLDLSDQVIAASTPVNMIPLAFTYPDFQPWKTGLARMRRSEVNKEQEALIFLEGGRGEQHGLNGLVYWILQFNMPQKSCHSEPYPEMEYGLHKYKRFALCLTPDKEHSEDIYFYDAKDGSEQDVLIHCPPLNRTTEKCRFHINVDDLGLVGVNFSAPRSLVANWKQVVADYVNFITPFYKDEIAHMKKPTPMSEEQKREIDVHKEWKP